MQNNGRGRGWWPEWWRPHWPDWPATTGDRPWTFHPTAGARLHKLLTNCWCKSPPGCLRPHMGVRRPYQGVEGFARCNQVKLSIEPTSEAAFQHQQHGDWCFLEFGILSSKTQFDSGFWILIHSHKSCPPFLLTTLWPQKVSFSFTRREFP